jgi:hypothetical protein
MSHYIAYFPLTFTNNIGARKANMEKYKLSSNLSATIDETCYSLEL